MYRQTMVNVDTIKNATHYETVGYVGLLGDISWAILELPYGCVATVYIHKKGVKQKVAERETLDKSYNAIAKWINNAEETLKIQPGQEA